MDRIREVLYEASRILLVGVAIALLITGVMRYFHTPTIEDFKRDYTAAANREEQIAVSDTGLERFPVADLLLAIEQQTADTNLVCHVQGHSIGKSIYKKSSNFTEAIRQCGGSCTYGCFHGVMMQMFSTESDTLGGAVEEESTDAYIKRVEEGAHDLCTRPDVESVVRTRSCYHGLGHVFVYVSENDIDAAIRLCDTLKTAYGRANCATGAFMEYLMSSSSKHIQNTTGDDVCDAYPQYRRACYRYKAYGWMNAWGGYEQALQGCSQFGNNRLLCIQATAQAQAAAVLAESAESIRRLCGSLQGEGRIACVEGALLRVTELSNGDDTDAACDRVEEPYHQHCLDLIRFFRTAESREL